MKNYLLFFTLFLFFNYAFSKQNEIVFPSEKRPFSKEECALIKRPCSFDEKKICSKKYCGVYLSQFILDEFVKQNRLIGKKFHSIFDLEDFLKKNLPKELSHMSINLTSKDSINKNKENFNSNRINVILNSDNYIIKFIIG